MATVIELSSSPEPLPKTRSSVLDEYGRVQKSKALHAALELWDSDSEGDDRPPWDLTSPSVQNARPVRASAGPSNVRQEKDNELIQSRVGASSTSNNVPTQLPLNVGGTSKTPLFFVPSDEENRSLYPPRAWTRSPVRVMTQSELAAAPTIVTEDTPEELLPEIQLHTTSELEPKQDPVARILEIVPDVEPDHVLSLVQKHSFLELPDHLLAQHIIHILFENSSYPKVDRKGKRKQTSAEGGTDDAEGTPLKKAKTDYASKSRPFNGGVHYFNLALDQLQTDFPYIPKPYLRTALGIHNRFYTPTYLFLKQGIRDHERKGTHLPYTPKVTPYRPVGNAKGKKNISDSEFDAERAWVESQNFARNFPKATEEDGVECGCCFTTYPFSQMVQCPETHLFCSDCMTAYAETLLGSQDPSIKCMDQSGCKAELPVSELRRFLPQKLVELWERIKQRKEVEAAELEGLEECPFCDWRCIIENPDEKLFKCGNLETCGEISCRACKKPDHLPKNCKEAEDDRHLNGQHTIEEAMTRALMRNCPKCKKAFIKEGGCNSMTCPNCGTVSCYVCRMAIRDYGHFDSNPDGVDSSGKCPLNDEVEERHADEVRKAGKAALEQYKRNNPDVDEGKIKVDLNFPPKRHPKTRTNNVLNLPVYNPVDRINDRFFYDRTIELARAQPLQPLNFNAPMLPFMPPPPPPPPLYNDDLNAQFAQRPMPTPAAPARVAAAPRGRRRER